MSQFQLPQITKRIEIDYGHRLANHNGKCRHYHGHRGVIQATFGTQVMSDGMVADFGVLKATMEAVARNWDHGMILQEGDPMIALAGNQLPEARVCVIDRPPTAENLAVLYFEELYQAIHHAVRLKKVRFYETPTSYADYRG